MVMVNGGFPRPRAYGFKLVETGELAAGRQWIIYSSSGAANSRRFFDELSPLQSLAIYRQWLGEGRRRTTTRHGLLGRPGSQDVLPAAFGILARASARAVAEGQDD